MSAAISARQVAVTFPGHFRRPGVPALQSVDLEVAPGAIVGVLGPNGSGKTTLLRTIAGLQRPSRGSVVVLGHPADARALRGRVGYQPEGPLPLGLLNGREFLQWCGAGIGLPNRAADQQIAGLLTRFDLQAAARRRVRTYSTGMQKRLALAATLLGDPAVLLLDEPTAGLDPVGSGLVLEILRERARDGAAIVLASHHLQEVEQICGEILLLHEGQCRMRGTLDQLLGTGDRALIVRGLEEAALPAVGAELQRHGAQLLRTEHAREHLFSLFRRLGGGGRGASPSP